MARARAWLLALLLALLLLVDPGCPSAATPVSVEVDWASFLGRSDLQWAWAADTTRTNGTQYAPQGWWEMAFTGNGMLGAMVQARNSSAAPTAVGTLWVELGRTDVFDRRMPNTTLAKGNVRCDRPRLPVGALQLVLGAPVVAGQMRQVLFDAEVRAELALSDGSVVNVTVLTDAVRDVHVVRAARSGGTTGSIATAPDVAWHPAQGDSPWPGSCHGYEPNPRVTTRHEGAGIVLTTQALLAGSCYATALARHELSPAELVWFVSTSAPLPSCAAAEQTALDAVGQASRLGLAALVAEHRAWWHSYFPRAFVSLTHPKLEQYYWVQMYALGSATRPNQPGPSYGAFDHTGPWFMASDTCCPLFNWDMNLPVQYRVVATSNRLELGESLLRLLNDSAVQGYLRANARPFTDGSMTSAATIAGFDMYSDALPAPPAYSGNLIWVLSEVWRMRLADMSRRWLPELYRLLRGAVNYLLHYTEPRADGRLGLVRMFSPEFRLGAAPGDGDTTYTLALLQWGLRTLLWLIDELRVADPRRAEYARAQDTLVDFHTSALPVSRGGGLMVAAGLPFNYTHRHYSHLLACDHLLLLNWTAPPTGPPSLCETSLDNWASLAYAGGTYESGGWDSFSYAGAVPLNVRAGRPSAALGNLTFLLRHVWPTMLPSMLPQRAAIQPNTFAGEGDGTTHADPTSETPLAIASAVQDLLLMSDHHQARAAGAGAAFSTIRVFGGIPEETASARFADLRAAGGFLVSGARSDGRTAFVQLTSELGGAFRLFGLGEATLPRPLACSPPCPALQEHPDGSLSFPLAASATATLFSQAHPPPFVVQPVPAPPACRNWWGYRPGKPPCDL